MTIMNQRFKKQNFIFELFEEPELIEENEGKELFDKEDYNSKKSSKINEAELVEMFKNDFKVNLSFLMRYLWEQPKAVTYIIKQIDNKNLNNYLAPFFVNNFYENILSPKYIEDDLLYVLTLLLKDEIKDLNNINEKVKFLNNTTCGYLLEQLRKKIDIESFFKTIILKALEDLETEHSNKLFNFELSKKQENKNKDSNRIVINVYKKRDTIEKLEDFNKKYMPNLEKEIIEMLIKKNENNKRICDYFHSKLNDLLSNKDYYSNKQFKNNYNTYEDSQKILYMDYFTASISFINSIIDKILNNPHLIPYSIKCFCKIISLLIGIKFPKINEFEKNAFIAKFFFGKLLKPILMNPGIEVIINNFIISKNTLDNLKIICDIINKFLSGQFYISEKKSDYTPFNWYFIEKIEQLFNIFDNITKVQLPSFIEKLINDELPLDYEYDYFKQNPDEIINHRSFCITKEQLNILVNAMNKCKDQIFKDVGTKQKNEIILQKLLSRSTEELLNGVVKINKKGNGKDKETEKTQKPKNKEEKEKKKQKDIQIKKIHYFLISEFLTNEKFKDLFRSEEEMNDFLIKEEEKDLNEEKNIIKEIKNLLGVLLNNCNKFVITDFDRSKIGNTKDILNQLDILMKSSNYVLDQSIPLYWFKDSLLEYLQKVPPHLSENDFNELYDEIKNEINKSIKQYDFELFPVYYEKLEFCIKNKKYYRDIANYLIDIKINYETKNIIEEEFIPVEIKFYLTDKVNEYNEEYKNGNINPENDIIEIGKFNITTITNNIFKSEDRNNEMKIKKYEDKKDCILCFTIDDFTNKFPNLIIFEEQCDLDILLIQEKLKFKEKLKSYFDIVQQALEKKGIKELNLINDKIYNYVMSKIYIKIFPFEPSDEDRDIFQKSEKLSWTEPKHFIKKKGKEMMYGNFFDDIKTFFDLICNEKSIKKKYSNIHKIFDSIQRLLHLNNITDGGVEDELPILIYSLIKSPQMNIFSNLRFMELYLWNTDKTKKIGKEIAQLRGAIQFIIKIDWKDLNVTEEEYKNKCEKG